MDTIAFSWLGSNGLKDQLCRPLARASIRIARHGRPISLSLWPVTGSALRIQCRMHDVGDRLEVGVLEFCNADIPLHDETNLPISPSFHGPIEISKLLITEAGIIAESGIVLTAADGRTITIVAGAFPYSLAVRGLHSAPHVFEPEYPIEQYVTFRWT